MIWLYFILLFFVSLLGSFIPYFFKKMNDTWMMLLLAFSGSFLLGITLLHLMPETFHELDHKAGIFILGGFFLQLLLQKFSHGVEHGHVHESHAGHPHHITPIFVGLSIHAFMEGIPLGFNFQEAITLPSIFLGVAAHKLPESLTLGVLLFASSRSKKEASFLLILFALMSPIAGILSMYLGQKFYFISSILTNIIPIVVGAFLHIATTILYESGTKHHELSKQKVGAVILGVGIAILTLLFH